VTQILSALATHTVALVLYPGLLTMVIFGLGAEVAWTRVAQGHWVLLPMVRELR